MRNYDKKHTDAQSRILPSPNRSTKHTACLCHIFPAIIPYIQSVEYLKAQTATAAGLPVAGMRFDPPQKEPDPKRKHGKRRPRKGVKVLSVVPLHQPAKPSQARLGFLCLRKASVQFRRTNGGPPVPIVGWENFHACACHMFELEGKVLLVLLPWARSVGRWLASGELFGNIMNEMP